MPNQNTFHQWMDEYENMLRHIINGFEAKPALQDELFQDIALNIWKAIPTFKFESSAKTFVARIAQNVIATHVAKSVRTINTDNYDESESHLISEHETPYQTLDKAQRQQKLAAAVRQLSFEQQQVITLAFEGINNQVIADILDVSANLVGVRLQRAKHSLRLLLEG